jgi:uncharacterized protein YndB with AHSA1/START domain
MSDIVNEINAVHREVGRREFPSGDGRTVVLRRTYGAAIEDVWDAITNPDRLKRWFLPVSGDLRLGGKYQIEGNAGGEIMRCEPPRLLTVTWIFGDPDEAGASEVEVRLSSDTGGETVFELEHAATTDPDRWTEYGPGAVGVGWDLTLLGLALHLRGETIEDPEAWQTSPEAVRCMTDSSNAWAAANEAAGATSAEAAAAAANTTAFYSPRPEAGTET